MNREPFGLELSLRNIKNGNYTDADVQLVAKRCVEARSKNARWCEDLAKANEKIKELEDSMRWIPVTEKLPPDNKYVDFLTAGSDGHGYIARTSKEDCEKYGVPYNLNPKMYEDETGPYHIGKDYRGFWGVTHWRLRPGIEPDFNKFIEENGT
jgi:hypothetical protein